MAASPTREDVVTTAEESSIAGMGLVARICRRCRPGPLELRLFLIVLVGLLPLALLSLATLAYNTHRQKQQIIEASEGTMRAIITAMDGELKASLASLDALAASPLLTSGDLQGFYGEARELLQRHPNWVNVVVSTPDAQQAMNARLPRGSAMPPPSDPASVIEAARTGTPQVGNVIFGRVSKIYAFAIRFPVKRNDRVTYVLTAVSCPLPAGPLLVDGFCPCVQ